MQTFEGREWILDERASTSSNMWLLRTRIILGNSGGRASVQFKEKGEEIGAEGSFRSGRATDKESLSEQHSNPPN